MRSIKCMIVLICMSTCQISSAQLNSWSAMAQFPAQNRAGAVAFTIGSKGYVGSGDVGGWNSTTKDFWSWDEISNTWTQLSDIGGASAPTRAYSIAFSIGSKGYIGTGYDGISAVYLNDFWEYEPSTNTWTVKTSYPGGAIDGAFAFTINNKGYVGTGAYSWNNFSSEFFEYNPSTDSWTQKASFAGSPRYAAAGFSLDGYGFVGTGYDCTTGSCNTPLEDMWMYSPSTDSWSQRAPFPGGKRAGAFSFAVGHCGFIGGGYDITNWDYLNDLWEYQLSTDTWTRRTNCPMSFMNACAFVICDKAYVGLGAQPALTNTLHRYIPLNPPSAGFSISSTEICEGDCVNLFDTSSWVQDSWTWIMTGALPSSSTVQNPVNVCYQSSGVYSIQQIIYSGSCIDTASSQIVVSAKPPIPQVNESGSSLTCSTNGVVYEWYLDSVIQPQYNTQSISIDPSENGEWVVVVYNSDSCFSVSPIFTSTVGIMESELSLFKLYPNPSRGFVEIMSVDLKISKIEVFDQLGNRLIFMNDINNSNLHLDLGSYCSTTSLLAFRISIGNKETLKKVLFIRE